MSVLRFILLYIVLFGLSSCSLLKTDNKQHATDMLDDFYKEANTTKLDQTETYNQKILNQRQFDKPQVKALPHGKKGLISEIALSGKTNTRPTPSTTEKRSVEFDFKDIELRDLISLLFDEYLKLPYTFLEDFKDKKVNFVFRGRVDKKDLMKTIEAFLEFHGVAIKYNQGVYAITSADNSSNITTLPAYDGVGDTIGLFKCRYISALDFLTASRLLLPPAKQKNAVVLDNQNLVFLKGSQAEVDAFKKLHQALDTPYFDGKYLLIYQSRYLKTSALKVLIEKFEHNLGSKAQHPKKRLEVEELADHFRLVIVAADQEAKKLILDYLDQVDTPGEHPREMFQYPLSSQVATEVLSTVNSLLESLTKNTEPITVVADKLTNSLFFMATPDEYVEIKRLLDNLDFRIPAVHIDMVVAEVALKDHAGYGVEWFLNKTTNSVATDATLDMLSNAAIAGASGGLTLGAVALNSNKFIQLKLLADSTDFKVLSNPHIFVKNGTTATIDVGGNIAVPASKTDSQSNSGGPVTQTNFNRKDVSLKLEVKPQISMKGVIQLQIKLNDTSFTGNDADGQPKFSKRELNTELIFEDGQTLLLGGLIRRKNNDVIKKVPFFGDIPYLGAFFRNKDTTEEVTELIVLITPRLVLDKQGASLVSKALIESGKNILKDFNRKNMFSETKALLHTDIQ